MKKPTRTVSPTSTSQEAVSPELQAKRDELNRLINLPEEELIEEMMTWDPDALKAGFDKLFEMLNEETYH